MTNLHVIAIIKDFLDRQTNRQTALLKLLPRCRISAAILTGGDDFVVPGGVQSLRVIGRGSYHVTLRWAVPKDRNGILTGYIIGYRQGQQPRFLYYFFPF